MDVRQGHVHDRRVEPLHDAGADDRRGGQATICGVRVGLGHCRDVLGRRRRGAGRRSAIGRRCSCRRLHPKTPTVPCFAAHRIPVLGEKSKRASRPSRWALTQHPYEGRTGRRSGASRADQADDREMSPTRYARRQVAVCWPRARIGCTPSRRMPGEDRQLQPTPDDVDPDIRRRPGSRSCRCILKIVHVRLGGRPGVTASLHRNAVQTRSCAIPRGVTYGVVFTP